MPILALMFVLFVFGVAIFSYFNKAKDSGLAKSTGGNTSKYGLVAVAAFLLLICILVFLVSMYMGILGY